MTGESTFLDQIRADGFAIIRAVLGLAQVEQLANSLQSLEGSESIRRRGGMFAVRNLLDVSKPVRELAESAALRELVVPVLGHSAIAVRGILFDKTPGANWKVPWHQDVTIAVAERADVEGFGPWSTKAGILHVQPPARVLENMLSVRIHLDPCGEENGALKVVAGTHRNGRLPETETARLGEESPMTICAVDAGDALLMRPLLLHASSASLAPLHRRVVHIEFAAYKLPGGLRWASNEAEHPVKGPELKLPLPLSAPEVTSIEPAFPADPNIAAAFQCSPD
jgi:hypothetical protein